MDNADLVNGEPDNQGSTYMNLSACNKTIDTFLFVFRCSENFSFHIEEMECYINTMNIVIVQYRDREKCLQSLELTRLQRGKPTS